MSQMSQQTRDFKKKLIISYLEISDSLVDDDIIEELRKKTVGLSAVTHMANSILSFPDDMKWARTMIIDDLKYFFSNFPDNIISAIRHPIEFFRGFARIMLGFGYLIFYPVRMIVYLFIFMVSLLFLQLKL